MFRVHRVKIHSRFFGFFVPLGWGCGKRQTCKWCFCCKRWLRPERSSAVLRDQHRGCASRGLCGEPPARPWAPHARQQRTVTAGRGARTGARPLLCKFLLVALGLFAAETQRRHNSLRPSWQTLVSSDILVTSDRKHTHSDSGRSRRPGSPAGRAGAVGAFGSGPAATASATLPGPGAGPCVTAWVAPEPGSPGRAGQGAE